MTKPHGDKRYVVIPIHPAEDDYCETATHICDWLDPDGPYCNLYDTNLDEGFVDCECCGQDIGVGMRCDCCKANECELS